jgi:Tol biopolymer transport system component
LTAHRDQVWVPVPTWSPDSQFVACTIHGEEPGRPAEESQVFEIWALDLAQTIRARLTGPIGMWSGPRWSSSRDGESLIAYAEADATFSSYDSRYTLRVMDRDGSNKRTIFPPQDQIGMARPMAYDWSPDVRQLVVLYLGDLYLIDLPGGQIQQLTGDGQSTYVDWAE